MQTRRPRGGVPRARTRPGTACLSLALALVLLFGAVPWPLPAAAGVVNASAAAPAQTAAASANKAHKPEHGAHCRCRQCRGGRACCCLPKPGDKPAANPFALRAVCDTDTPATLLLAASAWQPALPPAPGAATFVPAAFDAGRSYLAAASARSVSRAAAPITPPPQRFLA